MSKLIVVADDQTGGNATGVLLKKATGLRTRGILDLSVDLRGGECDVVFTDSRAISAFDAYSRVVDVLRRTVTEETALCAKRIDSTLRGNIGVEIDAFLDFFGPDYTVLVVPAFPAAGRVVVEGRLLVHNVPLASTEAAQDPKNPILSSGVKETIQFQSKYPVGEIFVDDLKDPEALAEKMKELAAAGSRIIAIDAIWDSHITTIAQAAKRSGLKCISADPGPFTAALAKELLPAEVDRRMLCTVGTVTANTYEQLKLVFAREDVYSIYVNTDKILSSPDSCVREVDRVIDEVRDKAEGYPVVCVALKGVIPGMRVDFAPYTQKHSCTEEELSNVITRALAEITYGILAADRRFAGLYTSGGDVTGAVCTRLGVKSLRILDEVVPLATCTELGSGKFAGMKLITKGGLAGDPEAIVTCIEYMKTAMREVDL